MANKSCATNLLEFLDKITSEVDNGNPVDVVYLDFSKAFDTVPIRRLVGKLRAHRVVGNVLRWFENWLTGRQQRTVLNGEASDWAEVESGVPQGSVLGTLAILVYINDLDTCTTLVSIMNKFADDTKLGHKVTTAEDRQDLQSTLDQLMEWAETWKMGFNVDKCKVMHLGHRNPQQEYKMGGKALTVTEEERDIGVVVEKSLKPTKQCLEATRKANMVLGQITRSFYYRDRFVFLRLYKQFVRVHLEFSVVSWSPWTQADIMAIEKVQIRAVNMVTGLKGQTYE